MHPTVKLPIVDDVLIVVPDSINLITPYVLFEQRDWFEDEIKFLRRALQPGQNIIDIGANYGLYTLSMAKIVGEKGSVWSFEPASATAKYLAEGIVANNFTHVFLEQSAISSASGIAQLSLNNQSELNSLVRNGQTVSLSETVNLVTLDECMKKNGWGDIAFMKIDAEGEEQNILKGGKQFFTAFSPLIQYEITDGSGFHMNLINDFSEMGYDSYRLVPGHDVLVPFNVESAPDSYLLNLFCCKPDRAKTLAEKGFLVESITDEIDITKEYINEFKSTIADINKYALPNTAGRLPYGEDLIDFWQASRKMPARENINDVLMFYNISRDKLISPSKRFQALEISFKLIKELCKRPTPTMRQATFARIARDYGFRELAFNATEQLITQISLHGMTDLLSEPFLPPCERFDFIRPGNNPFEWIQSSLNETYELTYSFSSFYSGISGKERLKAISQLGFGSAEMERRLMLIENRFSTTNKDFSFKTLK